MRKLMAALCLGCVLTVAADAIDWNNELDELARETATLAGPQSEWREGEWLPGTDARVVDAIRAFTTPATAGRCSTAG